MLSRAELLVSYVQELERCAEARAKATDSLKRMFERAKGEGFDPGTLKVVLKLRKMTPAQRRERRALESIYMASLGMLDGEPLTDEARRRLDPEPAPEPEPDPALFDEPGEAPPVEDPEPTQAEQQPALVLKEPEEARAEGAEAAQAGKRIYDNPYPAGDPCRAAWDEGWCAQRGSNGMDLPEAYQRRTEKAAKRSPDQEATTTSGDDAGKDDDSE